MITSANPIGGLIAMASEIETGNTRNTFSSEKRAPDMTATDANQKPDANASPAVDPEFVEIFFEEAQEELANIRENLSLWRSGSTDREVLTSIRRSFHTLKGSGRMVGQFTIGEFAWSLEKLLNRLLDGTIQFSAQIIDTVDDAQSALSALVDTTPSQGTETERLNSLTAKAEALLRGDEPVSKPTTTTSETIPKITAPIEESITTSPEEQAMELPGATHEEIITTSVPPALASAAVTDVDPELVEVFQYEATEILDNSDSILERWQDEPNKDELLNDLRREMHTLKGSSRMTGFMAIGDLAHAMESVLDLLSTHSIQDSSNTVGLLQRSLDHLNSMVGQIKEHRDLAPATDLINELKALVGIAPEDKLLTPRERSEAPKTEEKASILAPEETPSAAKPAPPAETTPAGKELTELDQELVEAFKVEASELLDAAEVTLQRWKSNPDTTEWLNDLRREMHTLKGSSRMTGFLVIGDLAHAIESLLDAVGKGILASSEQIIDHLQRALDGLHTMLTQVQDGAELRPAEYLIDDLRGLLGEAPKEKAKPTKPTPATAKRPLHPAEKPPAATEDTIRVSAALLNELVNEMGESSIYRARIDQGVSTLRFNLTEMDQTVFRLRQHLRRLEIETEGQILFRYENAKDRETEFDPLELDRFSELQQLSRSLMEVVDDLANIKSTLDNQAQEMNFLLEQQAKVNKEIQQGLMRTRMIRFSSIAPRLRRVVRQVSQELDKSAELIMEGLEAEIDRTILENMVAPLEHMLRNAISHGIEMPAQRRAAGKSETGTITLSIRREGAELVLTLSDDGAGLNFEAIRTKGVAKGLLQPDQSVTEKELIALLLRPGFSTATKVTQISGRGVGMDVLNEAIKGMRGTLLIQSKPNQGTNFIVRLPFSLAVTQALLVKTGEDIYAVPLLSIESVARLDEKEFQAYLAGQDVEFVYRDSRYPIHSLGILFGVEKATIHENVTDKRPPVLLFRSAEASAALQVDAVLGSQEIIVKPVTPQFQELIGVSGAAVLGDGRVVVVLELAALVRTLTSGARQQAEAQALHLARQESRHEQIKVMVIDDSITMRKVTSRFLERHHMNVTSAKDGVEAVAKLEEQAPDLVVLDIEMPRMDGFEVAAHIRNQPHLKHIPIIMVTSRGGEKHRQRAARLGVNDYLTKPYQEDEMLNSIRSLLRKKGMELAV